MSRLRESIAVARRRVASVRGEILTSLALVAGWALLTSAIAQLVRPDVVWRASAGVFLLSLCGWKLLYTIASSGLYKLTLTGRR